jgi:drug/metabolite transporter (DMT)-like permease
MLQGVLYALSACLIWGMIFVIPRFVEGFSPIEVALGRYLVYGIVSVGIFFKSRWNGKCHYPLAIWVKAFWFSPVSTIVYYTSIVLAVRYSTPAICALIVGISPITIAFYGNWKQKECSYRSLIFPSFLILVGLVIINVPQMNVSESISEYTMGMVCALIALASWTWYVEVNSRFLKEYPHVSPKDWVTLVGIATLFWVMIFGVVLITCLHEQFHLDKYIVWNAELMSFIGGCAFLGIMCSWVGAMLWNQASVYLPVSLAGQLTIFETIFGVIFVYSLAQQMPPMFECVGMAILFGAVIYGIRRSSQSVEAESFES